MLQLSTQDVLAAAAAICNETAVKYFLSVGDRPLEAHVGFNNTIKAASSTGKDGILAILLEHVEQEITTSVEDFDVSTGPAGSKRDHMFRVVSTAVNVATDHLNVSSAYMLIEFLRNHCPTQLSIVHEKFVVRAAKYGNLTLLKILMAELDAQNPIHAADIRAAVDSVLFVLRSTPNCRLNFTHDQVAILRSFLDNNITVEDTAPYHYTMPRAVDLAAQLGGSLIIEILVEYGATPLHLQVALTHVLAPPLRRTQLPYYTGELFSLPRIPVFHMTRHLLEADTLVTTEALNWCEGRASIVMCMHYDKARSAGNLTDDAKTTVFVGHQVMKQGLLLQGAFWANMKLQVVLRLIANGYITMPTKPLPFQSMAVEIIEWLKGTTGELRAE